VIKKKKNEIFNAIENKSYCKHFQQLRFNRILKFWKKSKSNFLLAVLNQRKTFWWTKCSTKILLAREPMT